MGMYVAGMGICSSFFRANHSFFAQKWAKRRFTQKNEQFTHGRSFLVSYLSDLLKKNQLFFIKNAFLRLKWRGMPCLTKLSSHEEVWPFRKNVKCVKCVWSWGEDYCQYQPNWSYTEDQSCLGSYTVLYLQHLTTKGWLHSMKCSRGSGLGFESLTVKNPGGYAGFTLCCPNHRERNLRTEERISG